MKNKDEKPENAPDENNEEAKQKYLDDTAKAIVRKYVWDEFRELPRVMSPDEDESKRDLPQKRIPCGFKCCDKTFAFDGKVRAKHRLNCAFQPDNFNPNAIQVECHSSGGTMNNVKVTNEADHKFNYTCMVLCEGLLDWARKDASNEGDGMKTYALWKNDLLTFKATGHSVYAILAFEFVAQIECLLSLRKRAQLLHNRTVNFYGGEGKNIPIDYAIELLNGEVKPDLKHKFGTLTEKTIDRVGKSVGQCKMIENLVDIQLETFDAIGRHKEQLFEKDVELMVKELQMNKLFEEHPGRTYKTFPKFRRHQLSSMNRTKLNEWLTMQKGRIAKQQKLHCLTEKMTWAFLSIYSRKETLIVLETVNPIPHEERGGGGDYVCPREDIIILVKNSKHLFSSAKFGYFSRNIMGNQFWKLKSHVAWRYTYMVRGYCTIKSHSQMQIIFEWIRLT